MNAGSIQDVRLILSLGFAGTGSRKVKRYRQLAWKKPRGLESQIVLVTSCEP